MKIFEIIDSPISREDEPADIAYQKQTERVLLMLNEIRQAVLAHEHRRSTGGSSSDRGYIGDLSHVWMELRDINDFLTRGVAESEDLLVAKKARLAMLKDDLKEFPHRFSRQEEADAVDEIHDKIADLEKWIKDHEAQ